MRSRRDSQMLRAILIEHAESSVFLRLPVGKHVWVKHIQPRGILYPTDLVALIQRQIFEPSNKVIWIMPKWISANLPIYDLLLECCRAVFAGLAVSETDFLAFFLLFRTGGALGIQRQ